jgi:hypothetical protein
VELRRLLRHQAEIGTKIPVSSAKLGEAAEAGRTVANWGAGSKGASCQRIAAPDSLLWGGVDLVLAMNPPVGG